MEVFKMKTMVMLVMAVLALVAIAGYSDGKSSPTKKAANNSEDDATASKEPSALTVARKAYQTQVNAALDPIKKKYIAQLEELKKQLGGKGDLEGATAVQREIDAVNRAAKKENIGTADGDEATDNSYEPTGMWKFTCTTSGWSSTLDIKDDGTCHVGDGRNGTWEVKGGKLTVTLPDGVNEFKINKNATDLLNGKNKYKPELKVKLEKIQTDVKGEPAANGGDATAEDDSEDDSADDPAAKNTGVPTGSWHVTWKSGSTHLYIFNKDGTVTMGSDYDAKGTIEVGSEKGHKVLTVKYSNGKSEKWIAAKKGKWTVEHYTSAVIVKGSRPANIGTAEAYEEKK